MNPLLLSLLPDLLYPLCPLPKVLQTLLPQKNKKTHLLRASLPLLCTPQKLLRPQQQKNLDILSFRTLREHHISETNLPKTRLHEANFHEASLPKTCLLKVRLPKTTLLKASLPLIDRGVGFSLVRHANKKNQKTKKTFPAKHQKKKTPPPKKCLDVGSIAFLARDAKKTKMKKNKTTTLMTLMTSPRVKKTLSNFIAA